MRSAILLAAALLSVCAPAAALVGGGKQNPAPALSPEEIEKKVRANLERFQDLKSYSSDDPKVREIVHLGHGAVAPLIRCLREAHQDPVRSHTFVVNAGTDALAGLVAQADVPAVAALLAEGMTEVAGALGRLRGDDVRDALIAPLKKGWCSYELVNELDRYHHDPEVRMAMLDYMDKFGRTGDFVAGNVAEWLGEASEKHAVPVLKEILAARVGLPDYRWKVAAALVALKDKAGFPELLDIFRDSDSRQDDYARHSVGEALNRILGERIYIGTFEPGQSTGNFKEASEKFDAWWKKAKDKVRFDEKRGKWVWD